MTTATLPTSERRLAPAVPRPPTARAAVAGRLSISVVTPILNGGAFFRQTYESVIAQDREVPLEWIIVDGGSRDGTLSLLRSIRDSRVKWVSETDAGQAAAINKGLAMAGGDIVAWLNCDDLYRPGVLAAVEQAFQASPESQWLVGRCDIIDSQGHAVRNRITTYKDRLLHCYSLKSLLRINMISQPAVFWRRPFGREVGPLDENLYYTMDYDLWLRMAQRCPPLILDETLASFRVRCDSKSQGGCRAQFHEGYRVACRYLGCDAFSRLVHRINVEKIVWGYSFLRWTDGWARPCSL